MNKSYQQEFPFGKLSKGKKRPDRLAHDTQCVYCRSRAEARDHVPPKCLLEKPYPKNLLTVPSCRRCNANFSLDEEYFLVALAQVGFCPTLLSKVEEGGVVDRALNRSAALDDRIAGQLVVEEGGSVTLRPELERMAKIVRKIAYGLFIRRYRQCTSQELFYPIGIYHQNDPMPQPLIAAMYYWPGIRRKKWEVVQAGVFSYLFARGWMGSDPPLYCLVEFHKTLLAVVGCPDPRTLPTNMH